MNFTIYRPVKSNFLTQGFHQNKACVKISRGIMVRPTKIRTANRAGVCPVGYVKFYPLVGLKSHGGFDNRTRHREELHFSGVAKGVKWLLKDVSEGFAGLGVDAISQDMIHFDSLPIEAGAQAKKWFEEHDGNMYLKCRMWHLDEVIVDELLEVGEICGWCDNTGNSSGTHLHWSWKFVDKYGKTLDRDNGWKGNVDLFKEHYTNVYILDYLKHPEEYDALELTKEAFSEAKIGLKDGRITPKQFLLVVALFVKMIVRIIKLS